MHWRASLWLSSEEPTCSAGATGDAGLTPESGRSPGGGHGNLLQDSCLEKPMDRGACRLQSTGTQSCTRLSDIARMHTLKLHRDVWLSLFYMATCQILGDCSYVLFSTPLSVDLPSQPAHFFPPLLPPFPCCGFWTENLCLLHDLHADKFQSVALHSNSVPGTVCSAVLCKHRVFLKWPKWHSLCKLQHPIMIRLDKLPLWLYLSCWLKLLTCQGKCPASWTKSNVYLSTYTWQRSVQRNICRGASQFNNQWQFLNFAKLLALFWTLKRCWEVVNYFGCFQSSVSSICFCKKLLRNMQI